MKEESFAGRGGTRLFMRTWQPAGTPRAAVVLCHGVLSHSGQYLWSGEQLSAAGFAAYAYDHRGRGRSEGPRLFINDISEYTEDLGSFIALIKVRQPGLPIFLLGHSMGGVISCAWALDHQNEVAGFICESFAFEVWAPAPVLSIVRFLGRVTPKLPVLKLQNKDFTRDAQALAKLEADPLTKGEVQPAGTVAALLKATDRMRKEFGNITLPLLIMHGTKDKATVPAGSQLFYDKARSNDKTLKLYEGHFHDLLNDVDKDRVMADVVGWIDARISRRAAA
jgi:alpha-beta hydrolase superfamily lysophospholipase